MRNHVYEKNDTYPIAILVKANAFNLQEIEQNYTIPFEDRGLKRRDFVIAELEYNDKAKAPVAFIKAYLAKLLPNLDSIGTKTLYCADANYFKVLTKAPKAEKHLGYILPCKIEGYEHMEVVLGVNHKSLMYNPANEPKLTLSVETFCDHMLGTHMNLGSDIIQSSAYPRSLTAIENWLNELHKCPELQLDFETFSLEHDKAGIGTVGFSWDKHNGIAFPCDYEVLPKQNEEKEFGKFTPNAPVRALLKNFLETYQGKLIYHNANFDIKIAVYTLWMENGHDTEGLLEGLEVMTRDFECTKVITYLATNSCAGNELGLKGQAHEFAGNWGMGDEIKDIRRIPLGDLLEYNLVDCLSTRYVLEKNFPIMVADDQRELYEGLMKESMKTILQIELTGMPLSKKGVAKAKKELGRIVKEQEDLIYASPTIRKLTRELQRTEMVKANAKLKVKQHPLEHFKDYKFNPGSDNQKRRLLYEIMDMPVIDLTKGRQPATGGDTIEKLVNHTSDPEYVKLLEALMLHAGAIKILNTFIPAFENAIEKGDGDIVWLHGNFNLGGTVSGRLSSSKPNLQNLPSGSTYGKLIKMCFMAPRGWLFCGADFSSLEDRINALLTKDPNKIKVYTDGFDGHALRAVSYWPKVFPDIDINSPAQVNTLKDKIWNGDEHPLRGKSKGPTFALTFQGTWKTLVNNAGFSQQEAKEIEANYHGLYAVSTKWVKDRIAQACKDGYSLGAFGLKIRTPLLARTHLGHKTTPREAEAEGRTLGNAISGQSYGLLNNRACNAFMKKVWASKYRLDIKPVALIHDAIYLVIRDDAEVVAWVNKHLIEEMEWQDLPEIMHEEVKLGAELDIFWPNWAKPMTLPNGMTEAEIYPFAKAHAENLKVAA